MKRSSLACFTAHPIKLGASDFVQKEKILSRCHLAIALTVVVMLSPTAIGCSNLRDKAAAPTKEHEAVYSSELQLYASVLKSGMTRRKAEDYLRSKGTKFGQMCCIDERGAFADLVLIGKEKPPWWCGEHNVYIAFQFVPAEPRPITVLKDDSDVLTKTTIYYWLENCL
jgi:hypothetical protein